MTYNREQVVNLLRQYPHLAAEYEELATDSLVHSPAFNGDAHTPTPRDRILNARIERLQDLSARMKEIEDLIEPLKYHCYLSYQIISEHLLMGCSMRATAAIFHYSERHMGRLYKKAITDLLDCIQISESLNTDIQEGERHYGR